MLGASTSTDRQSWTKVLGNVLKRLMSAEPTSGWLNKKAGRKTGGVTLKAWRRRWFVLDTGAGEGDATTLYYYEKPQQGGVKDTPLGSIGINSTHVRGSRPWALWRVTLDTLAGDPGNSGG